jgi:putative multiple sugar transport system permease protein
MPWPLGIADRPPGRRADRRWQGFWVAYIGVPAFIVTLAGMLLFRGGNQYIGNADTVPVPEGLPEDRRRLPARVGARTPGTTTRRCCWACGSAWR